MLTNAFICNRALELAPNQLGQQGRGPTRTRISKVPWRLDHHLTQERLDGRRDRGWPTRTRGFHQTRTPLGFEPMQPTSHGQGALARDPRELSGQIAGLRQQHHLHPAPQARAVGLVVHLPQAVELPPTDWFELQRLSHTAPEQERLSLLNHASAAKSKVQYFLGFI